MSDQWLKCDVTQGMFSDELAVTYRDHSVFVPSEWVSRDRNTVKVKSFEDKGAMWAVLPTASRDIIRVDEEDLLPA